MKRLVTALCACLMLFSAAGPARATIAQRAVSPSETFTVGMLRVERFGSPHGAPIIFIPALLCGTWQWNRQIDELSSSHDVFAVTLPGFDGRPAPQGGHLASRAMRDLSKLIESRHLVKPVIVGHSLGGTLAVLFGETYPDAASKIIAAEGGYPIADTQSARDARVAQSVQPYIGVSRNAFPRVVRERMLQYVITPKSDVAEMQRFAERSDPKAVVAWMRAALSLDLTPGLRKMRASLVEIVPFDASVDPYVGFATLNDKRSAYERFVSHAGRGRVIMIAPSRHFVMFDRPDAFDRALRSLLSEND